MLAPETVAEAIAVQKEMADRVIVTDQMEGPVLHIAGMDMTNTPFDPEEIAIGSIVVLSYPSLEIVETQHQRERQTFPYVPGLLGFREAPLLVKAYHQLKVKPDLILVDGHGVSHPRGLGVASHIGVLLGVPTIGVAKSVLVGRPLTALGEEAGSRAPLMWKGKEIGTLLRSKKRCLPLIISSGHRVSLSSAVQWVTDCLRGYRLPEPTRQAHLAANLYRKLESSLLKI